MAKVAGRRVHSPDKKHLIQASTMNTLAVKNKKGNTLSPVQPKLAINTPGDRYEVEADAMAETVMRMPACGTKETPVTGLIASSVQRKCTACEEEEKHKKDVMRKTENAGGGSQSQAAEAPGIVGQVLNTPGQPLEAGTRDFMEGRFRRDFGQVRIHTDTTAQRSAGAVNALAYTVGNHIVFNGQQYAPDSYNGKKLLAHELTHVIQQRGATHQRLARQTPPATTPASVAAVTAQELLDRLVLSVRGFTNSAPGVDAAAVVPGVGKALGTGYQTYGAVQLINSEGNQILTGIGAYLGGGDPHAEAAAIAALERALPPGTDLTGARMMVVVDQAPCPNCASALETFATEKGIAKMEVYVPERPSLTKPGVSASPKTTARTSFQEGRTATAKLLSTKEFPPPGTSAPGGTTEPAPVTETPAPLADTPPPVTEATPPVGKGPTAGASPRTTQVRVGTEVKVLSMVEQPNVATISEIEIVFNQGLQDVNSGLPASSGLPKRIVIRTTQAPNGALVAAESITGEPAALAEGLARQLLPSAGEALAGDAAGVAGGEGAGLAGGASKGLSGPSAGLVKGLRWGGLALFAVVTGYQLITATPAQRPRVVVAAAGGFASGALGTYVACNLVLDLETLGWGLLICGFVAGGISGYAGSEAAGAIYDEATMTPVEKALHEMESQPENVRRLFYAMVAASGSAGLPIDETFVHRFIAVVPADLKQYELFTLAGQLTGVTSTDTLNSVIKNLQAAIDQLPERRYPVHPDTLFSPTYPRIDTTIPCPNCHTSNADLSNQLFGPYHTGIPLLQKGPANIILFPGQTPGRVWVDDPNSHTAPAPAGNAAKFTF